VAGALSIDEVQVGDLINAGLQFAANDHIALVADAHSTHLSASLKDLQKLGVDTIALAAGEDIGSALHVNLGGGDSLDLSAGALPVFDTNLDVTLDVANVAQFGELANVGGHDLHLAGIDAVEFNLAGQSELNAFFASDVVHPDNALSLLAAELTAVRSDNVKVDTIDMGGSMHDIAAHITAADVSTLVTDGLHFASHDFVAMDVSAHGATHLSTSMQDLRKLGIDTISVSEHSGDGSQIDNLKHLTDSLSAAGVDHLGLFSSDLSADHALLNQVQTFDWIHSGIDLSLQVDTPAVVGQPAQDLGSLLDSLDIARNGIDVLNVDLSDQATWGELIETLHASGLGNIEIESKASVSISDDLSAALYESGMLHALPDAAIAIDAGLNKVLNTSLKAMADLGVDSVVAGHKVYVELGIKPEDLATVSDLGDLFSAFDHHSSGMDTTHLFGAKGAGLVLEQATFDKLGEANIEHLVGQLSKLGFTELDVVGTTQVDHVFEISHITPQTPVMSEVRVVGSDAAIDLTHMFDPDLSKTHK
jgi:hypothetical protein